MYYSLQCLFTLHVSVFSVLVSCSRRVVACTNLAVTPGASADGNTLVAYNADSGSLMGMLYHYPSRNDQNATCERQNFTKHNTNYKKKVFDWDTGVYLGEIFDVDCTYNVVGNTNEYGLVIAETTFGGVSLLRNQLGAVIDYGSLIWITLQRSRTAREAMNTMVMLMDTYGYASEGESFTIADALGEVWIMEVIGRGNHSDKIGAVWIARRVPNGFVLAHSNQARIQTFPRDDPDNCIYAPDIVKLAKDLGLYTSAADDPNDLKFSFSDVYDPVTFTGARSSDARTWAIFSAISDDPSFQSTYESYAMGKDLSNRMPLWIKPNKLLSFEDIAELMANHYEDSALSFDSDVGAGQNQLPYRSRPLSWSFQEKDYINERAIATQQTGWNFIAQIRLNMPRFISSILWFAVDDSSTSPRFPVYGSSAAVSDSYSGQGTQDGFPAPLLHFDITKAFWVQNMVSNLAYTRWNEMYPLIRRKIAKIQKHFRDEILLIDQEAVTLYDNGLEDEMVDFVTHYSVVSGDILYKEWLEFYGYLFATFRDFYTITPDPSNAACRCKVSEVGFSNGWKDRIIKETGHKYERIVTGYDSVSSMSPYDAVLADNLVSRVSFLKDKKLQLKAMK